jgi:CTP:molybdopterin cytidylyltransferase MocA
VDEVVVVTGHARNAVEDAMRGFVVTLAHNDAHADGQQSSVRVGLQALSGPFDATIILLADQPLIGASDLIELIGAFKKRAGGHVVVPVVEGRRGNPVVLDEEAVARILASDTNLGCRHLIERQPELVHAYETSNERFVTDLDTVDDVDRLAQRTGWRLELPVLDTTQ